MTSSSSAVSDELASLHARVRHYESEIVRRDVLLEQRAATIEQRDATIEQLQEQVRLLLAKRFGASSEKLPDGQLGLFNEAEATAAEEPESDCATEVAAHRRARAKRAPLPETLERVDIEHRLEESQRTCPHHGVELERFGEVVSEQLDIVPAKVRVLRHVRGKYRCPSCEGQRPAVHAGPVCKGERTRALRVSASRVHRVAQGPVARRHRGPAADPARPRRPDLNSNPQSLPRRASRTPFAGRLRWSETRGHHPPRAEPAVHPALVREEPPEPRIRVGPR